MIGNVVVWGATPTHITAHYAASLGVPLADRMKRSLDKRLVRPMRQGLAPVSPEIRLRSALVRRFGILERGDVGAPTSQTPRLGPPLGVGCEQSGQTRRINREPRRKPRPRPRKVTLVPASRVCSRIMRRFWLAMVGLVSLSYPLRGGISR